MTCNYYVILNHLFLSLSLKLSSPHLTPPCNQNNIQQNHLSSTRRNINTMASRIPTSTSVTESAVIEAKFSYVWHMIKLENFSDFWSALSKSETVKDASPDTDIVKWTFKDGTVLEVKQEEHSVRPKFCL